MTILSDKFASLSIRLVEKFGTSGTWSLRQERNIVDPSDPTDPGHVDHIDTPMLIVITEWDEKKFDNINICQGDQMAIIPANSGYPKPKIGDSIISKDTAGDVILSYAVVPPVSHLSVNGIIVSHVLNLRG